MGILEIILKAIGAFAFCFAVARIIMYFRWKQRKKKKQIGAKTVKATVNKMDVYLITIFAALVAFTLKMISLFENYRAVPDTLITCVFAICGGECGAMSWIKTSKERYQDRKWQIDDENRMEEAARKAASLDSTEK